MIVTFLAESVKTYQDDLLHFIDKIPLACPYCQSKCHCHAWRERKARTRDEVLTIHVLRIICRNCRHTRTILPDFLKPYGRYIQEIRQEAILAQLAGTPAEQATGAVPSVETVRRWLAHFRTVREEAAAILRSFLAQLGHFPPLGRSSLPDLIHEIPLAIPGVAYSCLFGLANILLGQAERPVWI